MSRQYEGKGRNQINIENILGNLIIQNVATATTQPLNSQSPYKGLRNFGPEDGALFFGRNQFLSDLVSELEQTNLILLMGASGSGKSSIIRAGLVPLLRQERGRQFVNLTLTPDQDPFDSLYVSLRSSFNRSFSQEEAQIARVSDAATLARVVKTLKQTDSFWLLFIDQFEELFTTTPLDKRQPFMDGLVQLKQQLDQQNDPKVKIVAAMRADFLDRLSPYPVFLRATNAHRPMVGEMLLDELRLAIEQPAAHHGVVFEQGLVEQIIKDVQGQAGYLPLLQYTLDLLWEAEVAADSLQERTLHLQTYRQLGGVRGALQQHVDQFYRQLSPQDQQAVQQVFLKLVDIGRNEELGEDWKPVRRRALKAEFGESEQAVLLQLINQNLLVSDRRPNAAEATVEIAHEVLLTSWTTLSEWITANRQAIALRNRLYEDVARWEQSKADEELWNGSKLAKVVELKNDSTFTKGLGGFNPTADRFIDASQHLRERQRQRILLGLSGFSMVALVLTAFAGWQWLQSERQSVFTLIESADAQVQSHRQLEALLSAIKVGKQVQRIWQNDLAVTAQGALLHSLYDGVPEKNRLQGHQGVIDSVVFSPDGKTLATASRDQTARLWDTSGKLLATLQGHQGAVSRVVFSPDGKTLATASDDKTARLWDTSGKLLATLQGHYGIVSRVVFSPDGKTLATASADQTARLWDTSGKLLATLQEQSPVDSVVFSPDGKTLATASYDKTHLWNISGKLLATLQGHQYAINSVVFSPNGKTLATASGDNTARLWDISGKLLATLQGHQGAVSRVVFSPDGKTLATASDDNTARLWDTSGKLLATLQGHQGAVSRVVFSPDGKTLATASGDNTARLWDTSGKLLATLQGHQRYVSSVVFSPDGKTLATASGDNTARLWDTSSKLLATLQGHQGPVSRVMFSPNGKTLATASQDNTARLWDTSGKLLATLQGHQRYVTSVVFSPDGKTLATASDDQTARVWDTSGKLLATLQGHQDRLSSVVFSPDGKTLATASDDKTARLWDTSGKLLATLQGHQDRLSSVVFSPDGKTLATASGDATARLWDTSGKLLATLQGHQGYVASMVFSPDGKTLATASSDQTARVWDTSGKLLATLQGHQGYVPSVVFSPDGKTLATASSDQTARLWDTNGKLLATLQGHQGRVSSVVFSPDGKTLATASDDNTARLWNTNGKLLATLQGHQGAVTSVVFSSDGRTLATASADNTARLWQLGNLSELLVSSCEWVYDYLQNSTAPLTNEDRHLCDDILKKP